MEADLPWPGPLLGVRTTNDSVKEGRTPATAAAFLVTSIWTVHYTITLCILLPEANVIATFKGPTGAWDASSAVLLVLTILAVPEAITDQRAMLPEAAAVAGRFYSHTEKFITFVETVIHSVTTLGLRDTQTGGAPKRSCRTRLTDVVTAIFYQEWLV